jgi:hypothetical protein
MSSGEESGRPPDEAAEDQSTNELGFRDVDEEGDYDESGGSQGTTPSSGEGSGSSEGEA